MKAKSHQQLTDLALELYLKRGADNPFARAMGQKKYRQALLCGTAREDDPTPRRLLNWHFFPANDLLRHGERRLPAGINLRPTSLGVLKKRQQSLRQRIDKGPGRRLFWAFGRVLHHLHDMSTPSHVVPVYHGATVSDPFEAYLVKHWPMIRGRVEAIVDQEQPTGSLVSDYVDIYHRSADNTLSALVSGNGLFPLDGTDGHRVNADAFWLPWQLAPAVDGIPFNVQGFGSFGPLGKAWPDEETVGGRAAETAPSIFLQIAVFFMAAAVRDTLAAFEIFAKALPGTATSNQ